MRRLLFGSLIVTALIALALVALSAPFSRSQSASGWSGFPAGGTHSELTDRVIRWEGWKEIPPEWQLTVLATAAPDAAQAAPNWQTAISLLAANLGYAPNDWIWWGPRRGWQCDHALCDAMRRDFARLKKEAKSESHKMPGAAATAVRWAEDAHAASDFVTRSIWAGYALHYGQDAANPPHVDAWAEGQVTSCPNPHTLWELKDEGLLGRYWPQIDLSLPPGSSRADFEPARLKEGITDHASRTDFEWPEPPNPGNPSQWERYDPFSDTLFKPGMRETIRRGSLYC